MQHKIDQAILCLHISAALYLLFALGAVALGFGLQSEAETAEVVVVWVMGAACFAFFVGVEVTVWGLRKRKYWAWVVALIIFAMYVPSLFIPLGVIGLIGLLNDESRREFGMVTVRNPE